MPPINSEQAVSDVRRPRLRLTAGDSVVVGCIEASVTSNNFFAADRWSADVALGPDPERGAAWWADQEDVAIKVEFGFLREGAAEGEADWQTVIVGITDDVDIDFVGGLVRLQGRDLTARLVDLQLQETFQNETASEIVTELAGRVGLQADVTATTTKVGQYYQRDHAATSLGEFSRATTAWDLMVWLAQQEGFDLYFNSRDGKLHFHPAAEPDRDNVWLVRFAPGSVDADPAARGTAVVGIPTLNAEGLRARRNLTLAKDIEVVVQSWNAREGRMISARARGRLGSTRGSGRARRSSGDDGGEAQYQAFLRENNLQARDLGFVPDSEGGGSSRARQRRVAAPPRAGTGVQRHVITGRPGLTTDQALQLAQSKLRELTQHERKISFTTPGELTLSPRHIIRVVGTGTSCDQDYYVESIERRMSFEGGFEQEVSAKNTSPRDTSSTVSSDAGTGASAGGGGSTGGDEG